MIGYTTLGSNDYRKAGEFYDELLRDLGAARMMDDDHIIVWSTGSSTGMLAVIKPFNEEPATAGNGGMVALQVDSPELVASLHAKALSLGGTDEGAPGPRGDNGMHFAYFRDLDGNKVAFYSMPG